jgi:hypothetical protein
MESTQVSFARDAQRCPFCHAKVVLETDEWVACKQCLARHHAACWGESSRCSSCQSDVPMVATPPRPERPGRSLLFEPDTPSSGVSADTIRFVTSNLLEAEDRRHRSLLTAILTPLTLGAAPVIQSEIAFAAHSTRNRAELPPIPCVSRELVARIRMARELAVDWSRFLGFARALVPTAIAVPALVFCIYNLIGWGQTGDRQLLADAVMAQGVGMLAFVAYLHGFRETVRRHEYHQFFVRLVSEAVSPHKSKEVMAMGRKAWNHRRAVDAIFSLLAFVPLVGLLLLPVLGVRTRGALSLHEEQEEIFPKPRAR